MLIRACSYKYTQARTHIHNKYRKWWQNSIYHSNLIYGPLFSDPNDITFNRNINKHQKSISRKFLRAIFTDESRVSLSFSSLPSLFYFASANNTNKRFSKALRKIEIGYYGGNQANISSQKALASKFICRKHFAFRRRFWSVSWLSCMGVGRGGFFHMHSAYKLMV